MSTRRRSKAHKSSRVQKENERRRWSRSRRYRRSRRSSHDRFYESVFDKKSISATSTTLNGTIPKLLLIILAFRPIFDVIRVIAVDFSIRRWLGVVIPAISYPLGARLDSNRSRIRLYGPNFGFTPCNSDPGRRPWCNNMSCRKRLSTLGWPN